MCGIFCYAGPQPPNRKKLREIARRASQRGPDGFGIAAKIGDEVKVMYGDGSMADSLGTLDSLSDATAIMGHCRLPTQGGRGARHPFRCRDGWLAHNGNVYESEKYGHTTSTGCDTEVIAAEVSLLPELNERALLGMAARMHNGVPFVVAFMSSSLLAVARVGHPIFAAVSDDGVYMSSRSFEAAEMIPSTHIKILENNGQTRTTT